ncbi:MAG: 2-oxoglutarate dehydrogenase complex dihydrolipoyllysine-residue succinyltransferase [Planctomycetaceae bacterium]|nr:2-oxoglutarate dehydrogenase complex dihydrolipoyllysine-residue succinyltransferase [Planctomycetaceae bacterium]
MSIEIRVPAVGESITEVFIGEWYVGQGDWVDIDDNLVGLETDKATFDVPAPAAGTIAKVLKQAGDTAEVGEVIAELNEGPSPEGRGSGKQESGKGQSAKSSGGNSSKDGGVRVMPAAQRELAQRGMQASDARATGPGGRLLKEDVQRATSNGGHEKSNGSTGGPREERRVRMSPIRQTIAKRLVEAQQTAALLTTFNECDMTAVKSLRSKYQDEFTKKYGIKLGFMSFFVRAVVDAMNVYPQVGAQIEGDELVHRNYCDIGIAIGGGKGLVVPVLRNAERMSFAEIELAIADFGQRAQKNKIGLDELDGGTFTISNGGVYGSLLSTPIVNPPQSGVLGMHSIQDRPVAVNGEVVIRPMMYLALTYDHRVVDGREAVSFLVRIKQVIEDPTRLFLEV